MLYQPIVSGAGRLDWIGGGQFTFGGPRRARMIVGAYDHRHACSVEECWIGRPLNRSDEAILPMTLIHSRCVKCDRDLDVMAPSATA